MPIFRGQSRPAPEFLAWRVPQHRALRAGDWKIVGAGDDGPWELYNLARDGAETTDLAVADPGRVDELAAQWRRWESGAATR